MRNLVAELCILRQVSILGRPSKAPKIIEVMWHSPPIFQIKINIDGAARGSPGLADFGGIFHDHLGRVLGCFAGSLGITYALEAELQAVIHAIHLASQKVSGFWIRVIFQGARGGQAVRAEKCFGFALAKIIQSNLDLKAKVENRVKWPLTDSSLPSCCVCSTAGIKSV
ncbi:hypothetical protein M0R45_021520 [Rubus argutus]|uniref:RNase H type-1 domain-containing protein n=1 Tax=Rubus argutus TaxID=59490 RepID=A0AAW1XBJ2_RUBAR